ncbi:protease [Sphingomonas sp. Leaf33]|uniref:Do family serine endopeptidase n=1 Tax=Sphingomonas sp. Leaf33 TaxID=1736215 RepID=UPI0006FAE92E|nr:Do family serine endopeptidase [Sphingomonas sp. Leaf33]KQN19554.1 protease [Sphingomonas sp. Leaf33]
MRYAYALTAALLLGGTAATMTLSPIGAQTAQNEPGAISASAPRAGAPMSFADMVAKLQPAVVNISTTQRVTLNQQQNPFSGTPFENFFGGQGGGSGSGAPVTRQAQSLGSGFIISADGYVVTNNHVISAGTRNAVVETITVTLSDRKEYKARLIGRDPTSDLALLKIDATNLPFVRFGDSARARVGDWVVAIGNPFGLGGTVTAGIVSAVHRSTGTQPGNADRFIQTDASINQGNSGGPMFDLNGNVIGINSQIFSPTGGNVGIGFAIPAEVAKPVIDTLMKGRSVQRGYLGVGIQSLADQPGLAEAFGVPKNVGELIARVEPGEAADKAGIRQGDVVLKVAGQDVTPDQTLSFLVANQAPGTRIPIDLIRDGKRMTVTATVGTRPPEDQLATAGDDNDDDGLPGGNDQGNQTSAAASLGAQVVPLTPQIARQLGLEATVRGVVIVQVDQSSDLATKGLQRGDVISSIDRKPVTTPAEASAAIAAAKAANRKTVLIYFQRARLGGRYVAVDIK